MVEPQIVYLVSNDQHMTIAIRGVQTRVTRDADDVDVIQDHDSEEAASREFARWLGRASAEGWDLDPDKSPNPEPIDQPFGFEPISEDEKLWRKVSRWDEPETGEEAEEGEEAEDASSGRPAVLVVDLARQQRKRGDRDVSGDHPIWFEVGEHLITANPSHLRITGSSKVLLDPLPGDSLDTVHLELGSQRSRAVDDHGDLAGVLEAMTSLEVLVAMGSFGVSPTEQSSLRSLTLMGDPLDAHSLRGLARCKLPALESLHLRMAMGEEPDEGALDALREVLSSDIGKNLRELTLEGGYYPEELLAALAEVELPTLAKLTLPEQFSDVEGALTTLRSAEERFKGVALELDTTSWEDDELGYLDDTFEVVHLQEQGDQLEPDVEKSA